MSVHNDVSHILIGEKIIPGVTITMERVVENEKSVRVHSANFLTSSLVEVLKGVKVGGPPGLIKRLNSVQSGMVAPLLHNKGNVIDSPVNVITVHVLVVTLLNVPSAHPVGSADRPVLEMSLVGPFKVGSLS